MWWFLWDPLESRSSIYQIKTPLSGVFLCFNINVSKVVRMLKTLLFWRTLHILLDTMLLLSAFLLAYFIQVGWVLATDFSFARYFLLSMVGVFVWMSFLLMAKYYRLPPRHGRRAWFDWLLLVMGGGIAVGVLIVGYFFPWGILFSRWIPVMIIFFGVAFLWGTHAAFIYRLKYFNAHSDQVYQTLIVGANRVAESLIQKIMSNQLAPYRVVAAIDPYGLNKSKELTQYKIPIIGKLDKLQPAIDQRGITAVIQCDAFEHTLNILSLCDEQHIKYEFVPALRGINEKSLRIRELSGVTLISYAKRDYEKRPTQFGYRWGDIILRQIFGID